MNQPTSPFAKPTAIGGAQPSVTAQAQPAVSMVNPVIESAQPFQMMTMDQVPNNTPYNHAGFQSTTLELPNNFPIRLTPQDEQGIIGAINNTDIETMSLLAISTMANASEQSLHKAMDPFLDNINKYDNPALFRYIDKLQKDVNEADLPKIVKELNDIELGLFDKIKSFFNRKTPEQIRKEMIDKLMETFGFKTKTLKDSIDQIEQGIRKEMNDVTNQIGVLENLKTQYQQFVAQFAKETAFLYGLQKKSERQFEGLKAAHPDDTGRIREFETKLEALKSRALIVEGMLTKIPADQMLIRQIQEVGIKTLSETGSSMYSRFSSIKQTVIALHASMKNQDLQLAEASGRALDANLQSVNSMVLKNTAQVASTMAGTNRVHQAEQIQKLLDTVAEVEKIKEDGMRQNAENFTKARSMMEESRQKSLQLGIIVQPNKPLNG